MTDQTTPQDLGPELNIKLHVAEINYILGVLAKAPFEQVEGLILKVRTQAMSAFAEQKAKENEAPQE